MFVRAPEGEYSTRAPASRAMSAPAAISHRENSLRSSHQRFRLQHNTSRMRRSPIVECLLPVGAGEQRWSLAGPGVAGGTKSQLRLVLSRMTRLLKLRSHCRCTSPLGRRLPSTSPTTLGYVLLPQVADRHVQPQSSSPKRAVRTQSWLFHRWGRLSMSIRLSR